MPSAGSTNGPDGFPQMGAMPGAMGAGGAGGMAGGMAGGQQMGGAAGGLGQQQMPYNGVPRGVQVSMPIKLPENRLSRDGVSGKSLLSKNQDGRLTLTAGVKGQQEIDEAANDGSFFPSVKQDKGKLMAKPDIAAIRDQLYGGGSLYKKSYQFYFIRAL